MDTVLIDCDTCWVRGLACDDCVVTALTGTLPGAEPTSNATLNEAEQRAVSALAAGGLLPRLRLASDPQTASSEEPAPGQLKGRRCG